MKLNPKTIELIKESNTLGNIIYNIELLMNDIKAAFRSNQICMSEALKNVKNGLINLKRYINYQKCLKV